MREEQLKRNFEIEPLEPRLLLSADGLSTAINSVDHQDPPRVRVDMVLDAEEVVEIDPLMDSQAVAFPSVANDLTSVETEALEDPEEFQSGTDPELLDEGQSGFDEATVDQEVTAAEESQEDGCPLTFRLEILPPTTMPF